MRQIAYELSGARCLTKCPIRTRQFVGSHYCRICKHLVYAYTVKSVVICDDSAKHYSDNSYRPEFIREQKIKIGE